MHSVCRCQRTAGQTCGAPSTARGASACAQGVQHNKSHVAPFTLALSCSVTHAVAAVMRRCIGHIMCCGPQGRGHRAAEQVADAHCLQVGRLSRLVPLHAAGAGCCTATAILLNTLLTACKDCSSTATCHAIVTQLEWCLHRGCRGTAGSASRAMECDCSVRQVFLLPTLVFVPIGDGQ